MDKKSTSKYSLFMTDQSTISGIHVQSNTISTYYEDSAMLQLKIPTTIYSQVLIHYVNWGNRENECVKGQHRCDRV